MTNTAEPMTLDIKIAADISTRYEFKRYESEVILRVVQETIKAIDAELAKQREAEPVSKPYRDVSQVMQHMHKFYANGSSADCIQIGEWFHELHRLGAAHPKQRNAMEVTDENVLIARKAWEQVMGYVAGRSDMYNKAMRTALSAVASRDREDAKDMDADERAQFVGTIDDFDDDGETSTDYEVLMRWERMGLLECERFYVTQQGLKLFDAARRENKP